MSPNTNLFLVTGASGWLGKRLARLMASDGIDHPDLRGLCRGAAIRCLVLPGQPADELRSFGEGIEVMEGDLRSIADCEAFCTGAEGATMIHSAGVIHPSRTREFYQVNVEGVKNLLSAAAAANVSRAVIVSSNSPIGCNSHPDQQFDEHSPYHPYMNYGRSKMMMEKVVHAVQRKGDLETAIVRPPWFYGPDQPPRQTLFFSMIRKGGAPIVGGGKNLRSMGYVDNLAQGILLAAIRPCAAGETYWIADERPYSMNEIVDTIERLLECEFKLPVAHKRMRLPGFASEVAQLSDFLLQSLGLYHQKIHVLSEMNKTIACSIAKARSDLGYDPRIALEEGMRRSIQWCVDRKIRL
jgi:nucleoside-diphosphate-sugar epimerase